MRGQLRLLEIGERPVLIPKSEVEKHGINPEEFERAGQEKIAGFLKHVIRQVEKRQQEQRQQKNKYM